MLTPLDSVTGREEHENIFSCHYGNMKDPTHDIVPFIINISYSEKVNGLHFQWCLTFFRMF